MKISIISPVYNSEKFLVECLDSVLAQTFADFEIICVDNGSTDGTPKILADYAQRDTRVKVVTTPRSNGGAARNVGYRLSKGEYLSFLDSDDVFSPYLLETLLKGMEATGAEVACCGAIQFVDGTPVPHFERPAEVIWENRTKDCRERAGFREESYYPWDKLYKRSLIERYGFKFDEQVSSNDITFIYSVITHAEKLVYSSVPLVAYRRHNASTQGLKSKSPECYFNAIKSFSAVLAGSGILNSRPWLAPAFRGIALLGGFNQLKSQTTREGYDKTYAGMLELNDIFVFTDEKGKTSDRSLARYGKMLHKSVGELLRKRIEGSLAFYLGAKATATTRKKRNIRLIERLIDAVFEPTKVLSRLNRFHNCS